MTDTIIPGPSGRLEAHYHPSPRETGPAVLILHPHPQGGGTMHTKVVFHLYKTFVQQGFSTLRFNFRGVGQSEGYYDHGEGELCDAAAALDWLQTKHPKAEQFWVAGFSFGSWIAMQLLMRRPEIHRFVAISPPADRYEFNFLAPCPIPGQIIQGDHDTIVTPSAVKKLAQKLRDQNNHAIDFHMIQGAEHFFKDHMSALTQTVASYIERHTHCFDEKDAGAVSD